MVWPGEDEGGLSWHPAPDFLVGAGLAYVDQRKLGKYNIGTLGVDYRLSKRTDLFTVGTWQHAFAGAKVAGNFYAVTPYSQSPTMPNGVGASSTRTQTIVHLGIRHVF
ncbi:hypothetical protein AB3X96_22240 [Paraburkholderia sp. BR13439]|uniref:hypothetical protein n=1 Tax=Paraburkholderia sp. BR13439 TaxID=3236996 RepID=UPI0034CDF275